MSFPERQPSWHPLPIYHIKAPWGWINDPCAPGYDVNTGTYHLFYQWNPKSCDWGDICWGQLSSKDGLHWKYCGPEPVLEPSTPYDQCGIFTGCLFLAGPAGENKQMTVFYTSALRLPIHWSLPHTRNSESLSFATSLDGGRTWNKSELNPILSGEPEGVVVTGFRDPFLAEWPALDQVRGQGGEKTLYGMISGGIRNQGPTVFLYRVAPHDLTKWVYLGPLTSMPRKIYKPTPWTSNFGINWECVNFMTLRYGHMEFQFLTMGAEGVPRQESSEDDSLHVSRPLWMAGSLKNTPERLTIEYEMSGILDHGCFYAASSYEHPVSRARIVWGWLKEEDLTLARRESKGWTGCLSLPRELFLLCMRGVTKSLKTPLEEITSMTFVDDDENASSQGGKRKTLYTLGIRPCSDLSLLRQSPSQVWSVLRGGYGASRLTALQSTSWELEALINVQSANCCLGFHINHNDDLSQLATIYFSPADEAIGIDSRRSNNESDIKKPKVWGRFTLFTLSDNGSEAMEKLHLRIFRDGDVVEVFANDRFVLSAFVYLDSSFGGISYFVDDHDPDSACVFEYVRVWEELENCMIKAA